MLEDQSLPESLWQLKPWWCQPWSIITTGIAVPLGAWSLTQRLWVVIPMGVLVLLWWLVFLYLVPKQYRQAREGLEEQS
jgi:membrane protein YdbS with pleckstrin-like domain